MRLFPSFLQFIVLNRLNSAISHSLSLAQAEARFGCRYRLSIELRCYKYAAKDQHEALATRLIYVAQYVLQLALPCYASFGRERERAR